jgi:uncharacterized protein YcbX
VPPADDALRGVTIWRDTLRVPDAGDAAAAWLSELLGKPYAWCIARSSVRVTCPMVMASTVTVRRFRMASRCC